MTKAEQAKIVVWRLRILQHAANEHRHVAQTRRAPYVVPLVPRGYISFVALTYSDKQSTRLSGKSQHRPEATGWGLYR